MWRWIAGCAVLAASNACAQVPDPWPVEDDGVFIPGSMEKVAEGYNFTEGPVWDGARVIFSDISGDTVYVMIPGEARRVLYAPSSRANGHTFDHNGALLNAEHGSGEVTRWTPGAAAKLWSPPIRASTLTAPMMWWCAATG
ncbi:MAG: hypothetical protein NBV60_07375 [Erythrobacter sp.]|nr:hypothetical protein [Erythrobacter sp.]